MIYPVRRKLLKNHKLLPISNTFNQAIFIRGLYFMGLMSVTARDLFRMKMSTWGRCLWGHGRGRRTRGVNRLRNRKRCICCIVERVLYASLDFKHPFFIYTPERPIDSTLMYYNFKFSGQLKDLIKNPPLAHPPGGGLFKFPV